MLAAREICWLGAATDKSVSITTDKTLITDFFIIDLLFERYSRVKSNATYQAGLAISLN
jgi:hypothetical protein